MSESKVMTDWSTVPRASGRYLLIAALALIGLACSGCPALIIPGLAYQGYRYEQNDTPEAQSTQPSRSHKKSASNQQNTIPDSEIE